MIRLMALSFPWTGALPPSTSISGQRPVIAKDAMKQRGIDRGVELYLAAGLGDTA